MTARLLDNVELVACTRAMSRAIGDADEAALSAAMATFEHVRQADVGQRVRRVANDLQYALDHFHANPRLLDLAQRQVPDAKQRLAHVLKLTDDAAHHTMDLVERSAPLAEQATSEADRLIALQRQHISSHLLAPQLSDFTQLITSSIGEVRANLGEVLITQGYQDLSGQIIRGIMTLIQELEVALAELLQIAGPEDRLTSVQPAVEEYSSRGYGPAVPGIDKSVGGQQDVDALLSELGV